MNSKKSYIITFIIILLISGFLIWIGCDNNDNPLFQYNLIEILTCGVVTFGIFYFTITNEKKNNQNTRIESTIELIDKKLRMVFEPNIDVTKQDEYLHSFRYLDNKILILEKMTKGLGCDKEIADIKSEKDKLDVYINENLNEGNAYFSDESRREKIPNIIENIETRLDSILLKIYGFEKDK